MRDTLQFYKNYVKKLHLVSLRHWEFSGPGDKKTETKRDCISYLHFTLHGICVRNTYVGLSMSIAVFIGDNE